MANNIFDLMKMWDRKKYDVLTNMTDEDRKETETFAGFLGLRWMSASENNVDHQLCLLQVNDINKGYFNLHKHKELQVKLLSYAGIGTMTRHIFIKQPVSTKTDKLHDIVKQRFNEANTEDCAFYLEKCTRDDFEALCKQTGHHPKSSKIKSEKPSIDELLKEFDGRRKPS